MPETSAFWITGPSAGEIRNAPLRPPDADEVVVRTLRSGISKGTELQVYRGTIPESQFRLMRCPFMEGEFPAPVKYGYCNVGVVETGPPDLQGRRVFSLFPHQDRYTILATACVGIPEEVPTERAVLTAQLETAVNASWDAEVKIGDRVAVIGLGVIGGLVARLLSVIPGVEVTAFDTNPSRRRLAEKLEIAFVSVAPPAVALSAEPLDSVDSGVDGRFDLVVHASGSGEGLRLALKLAAVQARIVELSWYGDRQITLPLGERFHSCRLQITSSQVGHIPPSQQSRWDYRRRLTLAAALLRDPVYDLFLTGESTFATLPTTMDRISTDGNDLLCHSVVYP